MTLTEMLNEVILITNRPDMAAYTTSVLKASTLKLHTSDFFYKDIKEVSLNFPVLDYIQYIDTQNMFTDFRSLKYFRPLYIGTDALHTVYPGNFLEVLDPSGVLDSYYLNKVDIAYQAGSQLTIRTANQFQQAVLGYYAYPNTTDASYDSWIAREYPWAIIYDAAAKILKSLRYDEQANGAKEFAAEFRGLLIASNIVASGS